jgi:tRNA (guanine37-N1)-methyltransferase
VVGSIAILEIPSELVKKEKVIAETVLEMHKNIKTVLKKAAIHSGTYRTQKMKVLAGKRTKETEYKENNIRLMLNVEKVYFSPRLGTERLRITNLIKKGESVLVMFSGCAPYPCVIAKNAKPKEVYGVEINPHAHKYGEENIKLNKLADVILFKGDVRKIVPKIKKKFDRILMPLPKSAETFLDVALSAAKKAL